MSVRVGIAAAASRGDLLPGITGRGAVDNNDAFEASSQFSLGFGYALNQNTQLTVDFARGQADGKRVLLRAGATPLQVKLSKDTTTSAIVGVEYALNGLNASGLVLGAGLGYQRRDALTVASLPIANRTLFQKSSGAIGDVRIGYQFAVAENALLRVAVPPTYSGKREFKQSNFTALGLGAVKAESNWTVPVGMQFELRF